MSQNYKKERKKQQHNNNNKRTEFAMHKYECIWAHVYMVDFFNTDTKNINYRKRIRTPIFRNTRLLEINLGLDLDKGPIYELF